MIDQARLADRLGSAMIETVLCDMKFKRIYMELVSYTDIFSVACWYLWWQRRQIVHVEKVSDSKKSALSIQALAMNYVRANSK